jgi:ceramide glucosyltransferase
MKSTRFSRPKGHFGTALTFSMPYGLLACGVAVASIVRCWAPCCCCGVGPRGWRWARWWAAWWWRAQAVRSALLYPLRDLLGFCYWAASYVSNQVKWRGEVYNLLQDGFMRNDSQPGEREPEAILTAKSFPNFSEISLLHEQNPLSVINAVVGVEG